MEYKYNQDAKVTEDFATELKEVRKINHVLGFTIDSPESCQVKGDFISLNLKRIQEKTGEKKTINDCNHIVAIYAKGNSSEPFSLISCDELKMGDSKVQPGVATDSQSTNTVWVTVPRSPTSDAPTINMFTFTPATITPLQYKPTLRALQTTPTTEELKMADFSKVSIGVLGIDPTKPAAAITLA
jgi:hypothetical protein